MKTKTVLSGLVLTLFAMGMWTSALASVSKYDDYRVRAKATNGVSAGVKEVKHGNKYCREKMERDGRGGAIFPSTAESRQGGPKNYR